ncbi:MAG: purine-nucleoside phosphorylase [Bacteroidota bacterium]
MSQHLSASPHEIAPTVLLAGDPLRAKYIAETFLEEAYCYTEVRNMLGYTGLYKGKRISVQGAGIGMPSLSLYVHELINDYQVDTLVRVGTCGALQPDLKLRDLLMGVSASTDSNINRRLFHGLDYAPCADFDLMRRAWETADQLDLNLKAGNILSSDTFYDIGQSDSWQLWAAYGVLAVEMEANALYTLAAKFGVKALCLLTVSDHLVTEARSSLEEREKSFTDMMKLALELV